MIDVYLRGGGTLVMIVDTAARTMTLHDASSTTTLRHGDALRHAALPDFELELTPFFADALDLPT